VLGPPQHMRSAPPGDVLITVDRLKDELANRRQFHAYLQVRVRPAAQPFVGSTKSCNYNHALLRTRRSGPPLSPTCHHRKSILQWGAGDKGRQGWTGDRTVASAPRSGGDGRGGDGRAVSCQSVQEDVLLSSRRSEQLLSRFKAEMADLKNLVGGRSTVPKEQVRWGTRALSMAAKGA
jgi:hypothetical protein